MTREEFKAKAKEVIDNETFGDLGVLFDYADYEEIKVAHIPYGLSAESDMPLDEFLDKLYEKIKNMALEPSADCVSRKAIVEMLNARGQGSVMTFDHFIELLYKLPSVTHTQRWIPCSEGLPKESLNSVIGWDAYRERCVFVQYIDGHFQITGRNESFNIVAWQPLPPSYKGE